MSLGSWVFVVFCLLAVLLVRQALKLLRTEHIGTVTEHAYSDPRTEEVWLPSCPFNADPITSSWAMEPPISVERKVPALPFVGIRLADGDCLMHECTPKEFDAWTNGTPVRIDVYAIFGWTFYTSAPRVVA